MLIRFNSVPESVGKSNGRSGDWKFLFFGISKKSGYVQLFLLVIFYLFFFGIHCSYWNCFQQHVECNGCFLIFIWFLRIRSFNFIWVIIRFNGVFYSCSYLGMLLKSAFSVSLSSSGVSQCMWCKCSSEVSILSIPGGFQFVYCFYNFDFVYFKIKNYFDMVTENYFLICSDSSCFNF